jgi:hypothetical protein
VKSVAEDAQAALQEQREEEAAARERAEAERKKLREELRCERKRWQDELEEERAGVDNNSIDINIYYYLHRKLIFTRTILIYRCRPQHEGAAGY